MDNTTGLRVIIVGQAASGKTTLAIKLKELLEQAGATVVTVVDEDVDLGVAYNHLQDKRWDAVKDRPIAIVTQQEQRHVKVEPHVQADMMNHRTSGLVFQDRNLAKYILQSPITDNACHMISWPDTDGAVWVSDLDSGEVYQVDFKELKNQPMLRNVAGDDFGFSWCAQSEHLDDSLYEWVMEQIDE